MEIHELCNNLILFEGKRLWPSEDRTANSLTITSENTIRDYIYRFVDIAESLLPNIINDLTSISVEWGTNCPIRHVACRSFQVFRFVTSECSLRVLNLLFNRLSSIISDTNNETIGLSYEIICAIPVMLDVIDDCDLQYYPELFWVTISFLQSQERCEFVVGVNLLRTWSKRLNFFDTKFTLMLLNKCPELWNKEFCGIQPLLMNGL